MPKMTFEANELVNTDVDIVAMVKRGANRIPFRLTKKDDEMTIDLSKISRTMFQKQAVEPSVVAVVFAKGVDVEAYSTLLKEAGIDPESFTKAEDDASVTLTKADTDLSAIEGFVLKMTDEVGLVITADSEVVKGLTTYDWESTSFSEVMQKGTFAPSLGMAQEMLSRTFYNIMEKADTNEALSKMLGKAVDEFKNYTTTLAKGLPASVFKADAALTQHVAGHMSGVEKAATMEEKGNEAISAAPAVGDATPTQTGSKVNIGGSPDGDIEGSPTAGNEDNNVTPQAASNDLDGKPVADKGKTQKGDEPEGTEDPLAALGKLLTEGLASLNTALTETSAALKSDIEALSSTVTEVSDKVAKTEAALGTTVVGGEEGDRTGVEKTESRSSAPPLLDTAVTKIERARPARTTH